MNYRSQLRDRNRIFYEFTLLRALFSRQVYQIVLAYSQQIALLMSTESQLIVYLCPLTTSISE